MTSGSGHTRYDGGPAVKSTTRDNAELNALREPGGMGQQSGMADDSLNSRVTVNLGLGIDSA